MSDRNAQSREGDEEIQQHHDDEAAKTPAHHPANRLGLDYRQIPVRRLPGVKIIDAHTHVRMCNTTPAFFEAANLYGISRIVTMSPIEDVDKLVEAYPNRLEFIAIPRWRDMNDTREFRKQWLADLATFREKGARIMKFWMAPRMRGDLGLTLDHEFIRPVIEEALRLDYNFMVHIGDPSAWFDSGGKYADTSKYGTKRDQYTPLEWFLEHVSPRFVIAAHMGGSIEEPDFLQSLLNRFPNLYLDCSATKWIVRGVAAQPERCRELFMANAGRILFGTDIVVDDKFDFDHYASRFWVHQMMWESDYRGESPIDDPDAGDAPKLAGVDLPPNVLEKMYFEVAEGLGLGGVR